MNPNKGQIDNLCSVVRFFFKVQNAELMKNIELLERLTDIFCYALLQIMFSLNRLGTFWAKQFF